MNETPLIKQYINIKKEYSDCVLLFRLGDFYEMFGDDAVQISSLINLTLTHRSGNPMCGIPYHAAGVYIKRLLDEGKKIAICEQVGGAGTALMERKVVRLITPSTVIDEEWETSFDSNFIVSIFSENSIYYTARTDISEGTIFLRSFSTFDDVMSFLKMYSVKEIVIRDDEYFTNDSIRKVLDQSQIMVNKIPHSSFDIEFGKRIFKDSINSATSSFVSLAPTSLFWGAIGGLFDYLNILCILKCLNFTQVLEEKDEKYLIFDDNVKKSLDLIDDKISSTKGNTLFSVLNCTITAAGRRLLKERILHPLVDIKEVESRLDKTQYYNEHTDERDEIRTLLKGTYDLERVCTFIKGGNVKKHLLLRVKSTIIQLQEILNSCNKNTATTSIFSSNITREEYMSLLSLSKEIDDNIDDDPTSVYLINRQNNRMLLEIQKEIDDINKDISSYCLKLRADTNISTLKINKQKNLGLVIEVSPSQYSKIDQSWSEVQSLTTSKRFKTEYLLALDEKLTLVEKKYKDIEDELYTSICNKTINSINSLYKASLIIKELDYFTTLSVNATKYNYTRPVFTSTGEINIKNGRHPIVERFTNSFVSNSIKIGGANSTFLLLTGPNMAGKSTYMRQNALIIIMALIGSFVSAERAIITPPDRIFSRLGSADNISEGESTFFIEMKETANILSSATSSSFVLLDEIGRGTGNTEGEAIAFAVLELLSQRRIKTIFATHYLTLVQNIKLENFRPITLLVDERGGNVKYLRKVENGVASQSYAFYVASITGIPQSVIERAKWYFKNKANQTVKSQTITIQDNPDLFDDVQDNTELLETKEKLELLEDKIKSFDINNKTPLECLKFLEDLQKNI